MQLGKEILYAIRSLSKSRSFTILSIGILALGIGANTAIFSVFYGVLLKSLPYPDADRIVLVWGTNQRAGTNHDPVSATDLADYRAQNKSFEEMATFMSWRPILSGVHDTERISALQIGDGYFRVMKSKIILGRTFLPEEQNDGKDFVVVLSYGLWQRQFGKDPSIVGKEIRLNARRYIVVGVLSADSHSLPKGLVDDSAELYRPVAEAYDNKERSSRHLNAIGRLKSGANTQTAQAEMSAIAKRLEQIYPDDDTGRGIRLVSFPEEITGKIRRALYLLAGAAGLVLLIACANIANLLLARSSEREHEMAIRVSLGAPKSALIRQVLAECLLISIVGSVIGVLFAFSAVQIISTVALKVIPQIQSVHLNIPVLFFNIVISLLSCCLLGIAPAHHINSLNLHDALKESSRGSGTGVEKHRLRSMLVISEMALAIILLTGAGLLIRSVIELYNVNPGFNPNGVITMNVRLPAAKYPEDQQRVNFYKNANDRINTLPGIKSSGFTTVLPLSSNFDGRGIIVEGQPRDPSNGFEADMYVVTPGYLNALMIPLRDGRFLTDQDTEKSSMVVLVSETMGKQLWSGKNPIGHRIRLDNGDPASPWRTVVGIVGDVKQYGLNTTSPWQFYVPNTQFSSYGMTLVARTDGDPINYVSTIRNEILKIDPEQPAYDVSPLDEVLGDSIAVNRFSMILLAVFALMALLLASAGIYAVISYLTTRRTHEIGIRLALGAQQHNVLTMVLRQGLFMAFTGAATGIIAAMVLARLTSSLLFHVKSYDPLTYIAIASLLIAVAAIACCVPAFRASKVDPMIALRYE
jgi:putative ABC transport system permease protein